MTEKDVLLDFISYLRQETSGYQYTFSLSDLKEYVDDYIADKVRSIK